MTAHANDKVAHATNTPCTNPSKLAMDFFFKFSAMKWVLAVLFSLNVFADNDALAEEQMLSEERCEFLFEVPGNVVRCLNRDGDKPDQLVSQDHRPIYDCLDKDNRLYHVLHQAGCWQLVLAETNEQLACLESWAPLPLSILTASPKLETQVFARRCHESNRVQSFHVSEVASFKGFSGFYVRIHGEELFFGVTSRYYAWRSRDNGEYWFFSKHWEDVFTNAAASFECHIPVDDPNRVQSCFLHYRNNPNTIENVQILFTFDSIEHNIHQRIILARDESRIHNRYEFRLTNGLGIPLLGLGTGGLDPDSAFQSVRHAAHAGYGLIDTAAIYNNEKAVADALEGMERTPLVQTKVWPTELGYARTIASVMNSRYRLKSTVLDSVLLHWPKCYAEWNVEWMDCSTAEHDEFEELWLESWKALERLYAEGFVLAIGVSNFDDNLLRIAQEHTKSVNPMVVQNQMSIRHWDVPVIDRCHLIGAQFQAYSVFRNGVSQEDIDQLRQVSGDHENFSLVEVILHAMINSRLGFQVRSQNTEHLDMNLRSAETEELTVRENIFHLLGDTPREEL